MEPEGDAIEQKIIAALAVEQHKMRLAYERPVYGYVAQELGRLGFVLLRGRWTIRPTWRSPRTLAGRFIQRLADGYFARAGQLVSGDGGQHYINSDLLD